MNEIVREKIRQVPPAYILLDFTIVLITFHLFGFLVVVKNDN
jgi:hypothetical protein